MDQARLSQALAAAVATGGSEAALAVCRACVEWLPMTGASITMMVGLEVQEPLCATDATAARIDELQFSLGEGPCVESFRTGRAVLVPDIAAPTETRWPLFAASAAETGARGMFVFPLQVGAASIGVLDCYRDTAGPLPDPDLSGALRAADAAVWAVLDRVEVRVDEAGESRPSLDEGTLSRAEVHQATGMLMAQAGLAAPEALSRLRAHAFATGRRITDVADDVVARRLRLHPNDGWHTARPADTAWIEHVDTDEHDMDDPVEPCSRDDEEQ